MAKYKDLGIEPEMTLDEVAKELGITRQRVYAIEKSALAKLAKMKKAQKMRDEYLYRNEST